MTIKFTSGQQALWHTIAVGMFYQDQTDIPAVKIERWGAQSLETKLSYQNRAKAALAEALEEN